MNKPDHNTTHSDECRYSSIDMALYLINKLEPGKKMALESHLAQCEKCRDKVEDIRNGAEAIRKELEMEQEPISEIEPKRSSHRFLFVKIAAAIAIITSGICIFFYMSGNTELKEGSRPATYLHNDTLKETGDTARIKE